MMKNYLFSRIFYVFKNLICSQLRLHAPVQHPEAGAGEFSEPNPTLWVVSKQLEAGPPKEH